MTALAALAGVACRDWSFLRPADRTSSGGTSSRAGSAGSAASGEVVVTGEPVAQASGTIGGTGPASGMGAGETNIEVLSNSGGFGTVGTAGRAGSTQATGGTRATTNSVNTQGVGRAGSTAGGSSSANGSGASSGRATGTTGGVEGAKAASGGAAGAAAQAGQGRIDDGASGTVGTAGSGGGNAESCVVDDDNRWSCWRNVTGRLKDRYERTAGETYLREGAEIYLTAVSRSNGETSWIDVFATMVYKGQGTLYWLRNRGPGQGRWGFLPDENSPADVGWRQVSDYDAVGPHSAAVSRSEEVVDLFTTQSSSGALLTKSFLLVPKTPTVETTAPSDYDYVALHGTVAGGIGAISQQASNIEVAARSASGELLHWSWYGRDWSGPESRATGVGGSVASVYWDAEFHVFWRDEQTGSLCTLVRTSGNFSGPDCNFIQASIKGDPLVFSQAVTIPGTTENYQNIGLLAESAAEEQRTVFWERRFERRWATPTSANVSLGRARVATLAGLQQTQLFIVEEQGLFDQVHSLTWEHPDVNGSGWAWRNELNLGGDVKSIAVAVGAHGTIDLFAVARDSNDIWWRHWSTAAGWTFQPEP